MTEQEKQPLIRRLIKKRVIQSAAVYVAVAWGAVEIMVTVQEKLGWPETLSAWATRLFIVGFPIVLVLAWRHDIEHRGARMGLLSAGFLAAGAALWLSFSGEPVQRVPTTGLDPINTAIAKVIVVPFANANGDESYDYLANGFTVELIDRLSKHPDLAVIQEESMRLRSMPSLMPDALARSFDAEFLVEGEVLRDAEFFEVTANLRDMDGVVHWSDRFRDKYSAQGVQSIQVRISGEISRTLGTALQSHAYCGETTDVDAMELYFRGRQALGTRRTQIMLDGMEMLKQAVQRDPYFGRAWSQLGGGHLVLSGRYGNPASPDFDRKKAGLNWQLAMSTLRKALDSCPTIGSAYKILVPSYDGIDNASIDQELQWRDALAMDPNDGAMLRQYAFHLLQHGRNDAALRAIERAHEVEPMLAMIPTLYAQVLAKRGNCVDALPLAREGQELGGMPSASVELTCAFADGNVSGVVGAFDALAAVGLGGVRESFAEPLADVVAAFIDPQHPLRPAIVAQMWAVWDRNEDFEKNPHVYWLTNMAVKAGELDLAFELLNAALGPNDFAGYTIAFSPLFEPNAASSALRADPRFVELMSKTGYPEYWRTFGWPTGCEADGNTFRCY